MSGLVFLVALSASAAQAASRAGPVNDNDCVNQANKEQHKLAKGAYKEWRNRGAKAKALFVYLDPAGGFPGRSYQYPFKQSKIRKTAEPAKL